MSNPSCCNLDDFLRAMSSETRQRILMLLQDGEMCVGELVEHLGLAQPTISNHLAILRRVHLVTRRRTGKQNYYTLNTACVVECCDAIIAGFNLVGLDSCHSGENVASNPPK
jgi:DNA-binding transcriptional ArsR family regulator